MKLKQTIERFRRNRALRFWHRRGCAVVDADILRNMESAASNILDVVTRSGFLRNGYEHNGKCRHAERKLIVASYVLRNGVKCEEYQQ